MSSIVFYCCVLPQWHSLSLALQQPIALEEPFPMHSKRMNKPESSHQKLATLQAHQDPAINAKESKKKSHNAFVSWIRKKFAKVKSQS